MYLVRDLLDLCKNSNFDEYIYLIIQGENEKYKIPMNYNYYVADNTFFFEVVFSNKDKFDNNGFIDLLEKECENDYECWGGDIYYAPMDKVADCELKFAKNMEEVIDKDIFYNCYEIEKIESKIVDVTNGKKEILIYLK